MFSSPIGEKRLKIENMKVKELREIAFSSPIGEKRLKIENQLGLKELHN